MQLSDGATGIAAAFVGARKAAQALPVYPGARPIDLAAAYVVQDAAIALDGRAIAGWKVGRINHPDDARLGCNRLAGPVFADTIVDAARGAVPEMPIFADGFAAAEAEFLLHVAPGWDGRVPGDDEATRALIDEVRLGIEIASSPYPGINADGPTVTVSDFGNNFGLVMGQAIDFAGLDLCAVPVACAINGETVGEATAATMLDGPYGAVRFLLAHLAARGIDAGDGLWISTGAVTGVHPVGAGQLVEARFDGLGAVRCRTVAAQPR